ncbi:MAG: tRNA (guanosine(37)-N1)-methyltransferase TrmD [Verrucomicrobia bacterium GWC2_42_7]|nr:MAG: tRNA (guanosine(37)-N1)-methyltransferase TrmD [Verrucomicrobia bacterium GWC2_42_7]
MPANLTIDVLSLFPQMVEGFVRESMIGRACERGLLGIGLHNIRDWTTDKHHQTDDRPFGGGPGMLLKPEPVFAAVEDLLSRQNANAKVIYLCPDGEPLSQKVVKELAQEKHLILLSGHYEGIDQRVRDTLIHREISIGDYVLTNGTLAAAVLIDAVCRYIPGVLGEEMSLQQDSFNDNLLSFPQYTRPYDFRGMKVPDILLSGDHAEIAKWRREQQFLKTKNRRPDLTIKD